MKRIIISSIAFLMLLFASCSKENVDHVEPGSENRLELPLYISVERGVLTPSVDIVINGVSLRVVFDTGSSGLRILSGALKSMTLPADQQKVTYSYGSGSSQFFIRGLAVGANLALVDAYHVAPVKIIVIDSTANSAGKKYPTLDSATLGSTHFRGMNGILGVGLRTGASANGVANPLAQLQGNGIYLVSFPAFGKGTGKVVVNPNPQELSDFTQFHLLRGTSLLPNGYPSWRDDLAKGIFQLNNQRPLSIPVLMDTGTEDILIQSKGRTTPLKLPVGSLVNLTLRDTTSKQLEVSTTFIVNQQQAGNDLIILVPQAANMPNVLGMNLFFVFDIYFDQVNGIIGLRKKTN